MKLWLPLLLTAVVVDHCDSKPSRYWGSYSGYLSTLLDETYANRTVAFSRPKGLALPADVGVENSDTDAPWFVSNANVSGVGGMVKLSHAPVGSNSSGDVYGTLWYREKLPLQGLVVEWDFMYPDALNAHDMNWWFPAVKPTNDVYTDTGASDPFYVWGAHGWGGQLSGLERSDGGASLVQATPAMPGTMHNALYASLKGKQLFFLDGRLVISFSEPTPINATEGFFGFSVFESSVMLGSLSVYTLN